MFSKYFQYFWFMLSVALVGVYVYIGNAFITMMWTINMCLYAGLIIVNRTKR